MARIAQTLPWALPIDELPSRRPLGRYTLSSPCQTELVLLPGLPGTAGWFDDFVSELPPDITARVIAYPVDEPLTLSQYAQCVAQQLPNRYVLLAESFSGLVALRLLCDYQPLPKGAIFCATFAVPPRPLLLQALRVLPSPGWLVCWSSPLLTRFACTGFWAEQRTVEKARHAVAPVSPEVLGSRLRLIAKRHPFKAHFEIPAYHFRPTRDRLVPGRCSRGFGRRFHPFRIERFDGPHCLLQTRPTDCAARIAKIFRSVVE